MSGISMLEDLLDLSVAHSVALTKQRIAERLSVGECQADIARALGMKPSNLSAFMRKHGIKRGTDGRLAKYDWQSALQWADAGMSQIAIAHRLGTTQSYVSKRLKELRNGKR